MATQNRHQSDFETMAFLGAGAFGQVFQVRNRIDGQLYALKRIRVDERRREKVLREARLLSTLTHERLTRYYNCWIEQADDAVLAAVHPSLRQMENDDDGGGSWSSSAAGGAGQGAAAAASGGDSVWLRSDSVFARLSTYESDDGEVDSGVLALAPAAEAASSLAAHETALVAGTAAVAEASAAAEAALLCNICMRFYKDWSVSFTDWGSWTPHCSR
jgi:hypothetical protein